jgi:hypothetical protein
MLCEAYGDDASCHMTAYEWFKCFKNGRTARDDNEQSGQTSASKSETLIAHMKNITH